MIGATGFVLATEVSLIWRLKISKETNMCLKGFLMEVLIREGPLSPGFMSGSKHYA